ncbi:MAG: hypothetical protein ACXWU1_07470 [Allosphingosinicella sp.]
MNFRTNLTRGEIADLFDLPLLDLRWQAQQVHRRWQVPNEIQLSTMTSPGDGAPIAITARVAAE